MIRARWIVFGLFILWGAVITGTFVRYSLSNDRIFTHPKNRKILNEPRGRILDRTGYVLAYGNGSDRHYPLGPVAAHIIGYVDPGLGVGGLVESNYGHMLRNRDRMDHLYFFKKEKEPPDLKTTLDARIQRTADKLLGEKRGAIVVLRIDTGEILASVSHPNYDPNTIGRNWKKINSQENAPLLNRVANGYYSPGSVWKTVGSICLIGQRSEDKDYDCIGSFTAGNKTFRCPSPHGHIEDLQDAYAKSCNGYFIERILNEVKQDDFVRTSEIFMHRRIVKAFTKTDYALAAIGQGAIEITPLEGALLAATVANKGFMPEVTLVERETTPKNVIPERVASVVQEMMVDVVRKGTARRLSGLLGKGYTIGIKTGTAEKEMKNKGKINVAWMIGFAGKQMPEIAFAVVVEDSTAHAGEACSPIAGGILSEYFQGRGNISSAKGSAITKPHYSVTNG